MPDGGDELEKPWRDQRLALAATRESDCERVPTSPHMSTEDGDRRKRARKIIINPYADFAFTAIFFVEARRTECHGAASAMMP